MSIEKWEKIRSKGKKRFIWVNGGLGWGVSTAVIWSIIMELYQPSTEIWIRPLIALMIFPIGGVAFGHLTWNYSEKKYAALKNEKI